MKKVFTIALLVLLLALIGCTAREGNYSSALTEYFERIAKQEYFEAYALLSPAAQRRIERDEFINKHKAIYEEIGVRSISIRDFELTYTEMVAFITYTLEYECEDIGVFTGSYRMALSRVDGEWRVDWTPALIFPEMDWGDTVRVRSITAKRGEIFAGDLPLAINVNATSVFASKQAIEDIDYLCDAAAPILNMSVSDVRKKLEGTTADVVVLKQYLPEELDAFSRQQLLLIKGIGIDTAGNYGTLRDYPQGTLMAHTVGYVGRITKTETEDELATLQAAYPGLYNADSIVGKGGLEKQYEAQLRGKDGKEIYIADKDGGKKSVLFTQPAEDGLDLQLTIDAALQQRAEEVLGLLMGDIPAAVVVLDPQSGAVKVCASNPGYDLNAFVRGISQSDYQALLDNPGKPLFNHAFQGLYPPGSVFKPFTAAFALESGAISVNSEFNGKVEISEDGREQWRPQGFGTWYYPSITRVKVNNRPSPLNMRNGMITSDNIYFAYAALRTGMEQFQKDAVDIGVGEAIAFSLNVPKSQLLNKDTEFNIKLLADSGYGQGEILMTPLQLASTFGAFANGGDIMQPYIIKSMNRMQDGHYSAITTTTPEEWKKGVIAQSSVDTIVPMLEAVVKEGTGQSLRLGESVRVAGKTGTAQIGEDRRREIAWFCGFWLAEEEARLALVMMEVPANSVYSGYRFDIAREMLKK